MHIFYFFLIYSLTLTIQSRAKYSVGKAVNSMVKKTTYTSSVAGSALEG
jgi:hypothetical protein